MVTTSTPVRVDLVTADAPVHDAPMAQPTTVDHTSLAVPAPAECIDVTSTEPFTGREPESQPIATCDTSSAGAAAGQYPLTLATNNHITQSPSLSCNSITAPSLITKTDQTLNITPLQATEGYALYSQVRETFGIRTTV